MKRWAGHNFRRNLLATGASVAIFFVILVITYQLAEWAIDVVRSVTGVGQRRTAGSLASLLSLSLGLVSAYWSGRLAYALLTRSHVEDATSYCGNCGYNLTGNVSGQCPECGMNDVRHFLRCMRQKEELTRLSVSLMFAGGIPLSFLGPAVLATMFWLAAFLFRLDVSWISIFAGLAVVTVPLLYRMELKTRGEYFNQVMQETEVYGPTGIALLPGPAAQLGAIGVIAANPRATSSLFVEFFLLGPRLVLGAFQKIKTARLLEPVSRDRAAAILDVLLSEGKGVDSARLLGEGETIDAIIPTLAYLTAYDWIGMRDGWRHVWVSSESHRRFGGSARYGAS